MKKALKKLRIEIINYDDFIFKGRDFSSLKPRLNDYMSNIIISFVKQNNFTGILTNSSVKFQHPNLQILSSGNFLQKLKYQRLSYSNPIIVDISLDFENKNIFLFDPYPSNQSVPYYLQIKNVINSSNHKHDIINFLSRTEFFNRYPESFLEDAKDININSIYNFFSDDLPDKPVGKRILYKKENIEISIISWNKNEGTEYHLHDDNVCATYVVSGRLAETKLDLKSENVNYYEQGNWNLVRLGTNHALYNEQDDCLSLIVFKLSLKGQN